MPAETYLNAANALMQMNRHHESF